MPAPAEDETRKKLSIAIESRALAEAGQREGQREKTRQKSFLAFSHKNDTKFKFHFINNLKRSMKRRRVLLLTSLASLMEIFVQLQLIKVSPRPCPSPSPSQSPHRDAGRLFILKWKWCGQAVGDFSTKSTPVNLRSHADFAGNCLCCLCCPLPAACCRAACGNWGRNFSSRRSNNSINHCQGSQLKGPSVEFSHVRYVNGIRKVFKQEPSWMYIYLNTHILLVYTNNMCVCVILIKSEWVCARVCTTTMGMT